ncbi:uncharacterized protein [Aegilops tauschii subsp. strangulata]|uniref:uncharacterized protein n=1 Tax=Aegilops tauschii subsp. strangulata TaxID=200361 RepID=UPI003CC86CAE
MRSAGVCFSVGDTAPKPAPVHAGFTMEQAQTHYNAAMAEEQPAPTPMSAFLQAQEEQRQHRMTEGQIDGERASEEAVAAMAAANPNFVAEQRAIYEAVRVQAAAAEGNY